MGYLISCEVVVRYLSDASVDFNDCSFIVKFKAEVESHSKVIFLVNPKGFIQNISTNAKLYFGYSVNKLKKKTMNVKSITPRILASNRYRGKGKVKHLKIKDNIENECQIIVNPIMLKAEADLTSSNPEIAEPKHLAGYSVWLDFMVDQQATNDFKDNKVGAKNYNALIDANIWVYLKRSDLLFDDSSAVKFNFFRIFRFKEAIRSKVAKNFVSYDTDISVRRLCKSIVEEIPQDQYLSPTEEACQRDQPINVKNSLFQESIITFMKNKKNEQFVVKRDIFCAAFEREHRNRTTKLFRYFSIFWTISLVSCLTLILQNIYQNRSDTLLKINQAVYGFQTLFAANSLAGNMQNFEFELSKYPLEITPPFTESLINLHNKIDLSTDRLSKVYEKIKKDYSVDSNIAIYSATYPVISQNASSNIVSSSEGNSNYSQGSNATSSMNNKQDNPKALKDFDLHINQLLALIVMLEKLYNSKAKVQLTQIHLFLDHFHQFFSYDLLQSACFTLSQVEKELNKPFTIQMIIIYLAGIWILMTVGLLALGQILRRRSESRVANIYNVFRDVPRKDIRALVVKTDKFVGFCEV